MGHHFVPKRYLKRFESPDQPDFIWLHDRTKQVANLASIEKVAQVRGFYSVEDEELLAKQIEIPGNNVIDKLINCKRIDGVERIALAGHIGTMQRRVPSRRQEAMKLIPCSIYDLMNELRFGLEALTPADQAEFELIAAKQREIEEIHRRYREKIPDFLIERIREPWPGELTEK